MTAHNKHKPSAAEILDDWTALYEDGKGTKKWWGFAIEPAQKALCDALISGLPEKKETDDNWLHKVAVGEKTLEEIVAEDKRFNRGYNQALEDVAQTIRRFFGSIEGKL